MNTDRRKFLKKSFSLAAGSCASLAFPSILKAEDTWGTIPVGESDLSAYKILEVFLPGGMSEWENFWVSRDRENENANWRNWRGLEEYVELLIWGNCADAPETSTSTEEFGDDINGTKIFWGPATAPLWRQDIFSRARMVVTSHADFLHFSAGHRALTGRRFGNPRSAGLGAAIQRHYQANWGQQDTPYSYVLAPSNLGKEYFLTYSTALGQHPAAARPLGLKVGTELGALLSRPDISPEGDALFSKLNEQYRDLLRWQGTGDTVRSADFQAYHAAAHYLTHAPALDPLLGGNQLGVPEQTPCVNDPSHSFGTSLNATGKSFEVAAQLLSTGARHVTVIDGGYEERLLSRGSTPYDTHSDSNRNTVEITSANFFNVAKNLADNLTTVEPGAGGNPKINLNDTLVLIHTEFNRTPNPTAEVSNGYPYAGREHFPSANVSVLLGGPISGRSIRGGISLEGDTLTSAIANHPLTPTDVHAGVLLAAGVDPFAPHNFTTGDDFSKFISPSSAVKASTVRQNLREKLLGVDDNFSNSTTL